MRRWPWLVFRLRRCFAGTHGGTRYGTLRLAVSGSPDRGLSAPCSGHRMRPPRCRASGEGTPRAPRCFDPEADRPQAGIAVPGMPFLIFGKTSAGSFRRPARSKFGGAGVSPLTRWGNAWSPMALRHSSPETGALPPARRRRLRFAGTCTCAAVAGTGCGIAVGGAVATLEPVRHEWGSIRPAQWRKSSPPKTIAMIAMPTFWNKRTNISNSSTLSCGGRGACASIY